MRVLVTGANGFVGKHLLAHLISRGHYVVAAIRHEASFCYDDMISGGSILSTVAATLTKRQAEDVMRVTTFELTDGEQVDNLVCDIQPDIIIHLAAQSMVQRSWDYPQETLSINTIGTINLVMASRLVKGVKLISIGSSEEYGLTGKQGIPLTEEQSCLPQNPYATSKFAAGQLGLQLARKHNLSFVHLRPFNHFGPGQRIGFVVSDFSSQIAQIEKGILPPILKVGDLSARRDFLDVRDVVEAYAAIAESDLETGVYNVCSGISYSAQEILDILLKESHVPIKVAIDPGKYRPSEVPLFIGSAEKLRKRINWSPNREIVHSLKETLEWWRKHK